MIHPTANVSGQWVGSAILRTQFFNYQLPAPAPTLILQTPQPENFQNFCGYTIRLTVGMSEQANRKSTQWYNLQAPTPILYPQSPPLQNFHVWNSHAHHADYIYLFINNEIRAVVHIKKVKKNKSKIYSRQRCVATSPIFTSEIDMLSTLTITIRDNDLYLYRT